ncbi:MAG: hypothetical protein LBM04_07545 [Opitutaceae bacterium]|nr:hypothetical protein [Opitutaceae bacterium]
MKHIFIVLLFLSSPCFAFAEESKITAGTPMATVEAILARNGFRYGEQFMLQWLPAEGNDFLFCRLDKEATLVVVYDTKTRKVTHLAVHYPAPQRRSRADAVIIGPVAVAFTPKEYSLTFKKEANQQPDPTRVKQTKSKPKGSG